MEVSDIRILRDFRNYFMELKHTYPASDCEIKELQKYFKNPLMNSGAFFSIDHQNQTYAKQPEQMMHMLNTKLNSLMSELKQQLSDPSMRPKIIELYKSLHCTY